MTERLRKLSAIVPLTAGRSIHHLDTHTLYVSRS